MRLASTVLVNRKFEKDSLKNVVDEINWYLETAALPYRIAKPKSGRVSYLNLDHERLDRVLYFLSLIIPGAQKKIIEPINATKN